MKNTKIICLAIIPVIGIGYFQSNIREKDVIKYKQHFIVLPFFTIAICYKFNP